MQPQRFPGQGPPMRPYQQQGYPPGPRPGGYPGQQMGPQRMGVPPHGGMPPHPYAGQSVPPTSKATGGKVKGDSQCMRPGMSPGMPPPPGPPGMQGPMDRKRPPDPRAAQHMKTKKKKKVADKILPQRVRDLVPESQAYMDLLAFERKLDTTIMRKRLDIQEALKRPMKQKRKLRIFISNTFYPVKAEGEDGEESVASWELRVEGRLLEDSMSAKLGSDPAKVKRKFSSFFKSLVIELDKDLYGPDNHLVEWHRTPTTQETDGFQVKRPGDQNVKCTVLLMLDYQPPQFKLDQRLARLLGVHTQTRPVIINALWQYIKTHKLQDPHEREFINCDKYLEQIFESSRMKFAEIPGKLHSLLMPPDPIVINHVIVVEGPDSRKTACYDIEVEVDDTLKQQMNSFLLSTQSQQEIASLDSKIHETVETINQLKTNREFFLSFAKDPQEFINNWLISQTRDLKTITDVAGNPEEERRADYYYKPWSQEAVCRYFYGKVNIKVKVLTDTEIRTTSNTFGVTNVLDNLSKSVKQMYISKEHVNKFKKQQFYLIRSVTINDAIRVTEKSTVLECGKFQYDATVEEAFCSPPLVSIIEAISSPTKRRLSIYGTIAEVQQRRMELEQALGIRNT